MGFLKRLLGNRKPDDSKEVNVKRSALQKGTNGKKQKEKKVREPKKEFKKGGISSDKKINKVNIAKWIKELAFYGVTNEQIKNKQIELSKQFKEEAPYVDVIWSLFNELVIQNIGDFQKLSGIYFMMALFLLEEGKNPFEMLSQSKKMILIHYKKSGILNYVRIISAKNISCPKCNKLNGKIFKIEDALKEMPLPNKECETYLHHGKFPFCRCVWSPHVTNNSK